MDNYYLLANEVIYRVFADSLESAKDILQDYQGWAGQSCIEQIDPAIDGCEWYLTDTIGVASLIQ